MINKKSMKIKALLLCSLALGFLSASAVERGYLSYEHVDNGGVAEYTYDDEVITLADGDSITFLSMVGYSFSIVEVALPNESTVVFTTVTLGLHSSSPPSIQPQILGPCTLRLGAEGRHASQTAYAAYEITRASEVTSSLPSNSVVIPTDATGDVEIILESSTDLVNWTAATAGTYGSSTEKRFFRVRAVAE